MRSVWLVLLVAACGSPTDGDGEPTPPALALAFERVVGGLASPVHLAAPPGDARMFIVEQPGRIRIVRAGTLLARPFLDITPLVLSGGERGLLSVAFHPDYPRNGRFFVYYTDRQGGTRVERYRVSADADLADAGSAELILSVAQPFSNHNGGLLLFGPDGHLYIGLGDGGGAGDPLGHGQNRATLLGSILRIDVNGALPYTVPGNNPFVGQPGLRPEIWAYGLRNPWRFAFDATQGLLYIADVGQNAWEEVNVVPAVAGGVNFGWNVMEGSRCFRSGCETAGLTQPVVEYDHSQGCSVTGGAVYRGRALAELAGHYFYSDYCRAWIRSFRFSGGAVTAARDWGLTAPARVLSFGEDSAGELYVLADDGAAYRLVAR